MTMSLRGRWRKHIHPGRSAHAVLQDDAKHSNPIQSNHWFFIAPGM